MKLKNKKHQAIIDNIENKHQESKSNPNKMVKAYAGFYFITADTGNGMETIQITRQENGEWIARETSTRSKWYSDPQPTLKELKASLGI